MWRPLAIADTGWIIIMTTTGTVEKRVVSVRE